MKIDMTYFLGGAIWWRQLGTIHDSARFTGHQSSKTWEKDDVQLSLEASLCVRFLKANIIRCWWFPEVDVAQSDKINNPHGLTAPTETRFWSLFGPARQHQTVANSKGQGANTKPQLSQRQLLLLKLLLYSYSLKTTYISKISIHDHTEHFMSFFMIP